MTRVQRREDPRLVRVKVNALDSLRASKELSLHIEPHNCKCVLEVNATMQTKIRGGLEAQAKIIHFVFSTCHWSCERWRYVCKYLATLTKSHQDFGTLVFI
jgi:hypothetical protein